MRNVMLIICGAGMLVVAGMENTSDAANPRGAYNRGYRQGIRTFNSVGRQWGSPVRVSPRGRVTPRYYGASPYRNSYYGNRGYYGNQGYYNRGYYGRPGIYFRF
jgi:hypothetical protein